MRRYVLVLAIVATATACGSAPDGEPGEDPATVSSSSATGAAAPVMAEPVPLLTIAEVGGCYMMGPNCATALVMSDGSFEVFRNNPANVLLTPTESTQPAFSGTIDVTTIARTIADTNFDELRNSLRPGECRGCMDGIDYLVRFHTTDGAEDMDSVTHEFDAELDLFAQLDMVRQAVFRVGTLEVVPRGS